MTKFIVITTINKPTEAILKFIDIKDWTTIIVGDMKTPHDYYQQLEKKNKLIYLAPDYQHHKYFKLSSCFGWNKSCRRSIGFIEAYKRGCDLLAHIDDDNIPYDNWGKDIIVNKQKEIDLYETSNIAFEPLAITNASHLWHRGYPLDFVKKRFDFKFAGKIKTKILVQANLWNGNPDIDAMQRIAFNDFEDIRFNVKNYYTSNAPFNVFNSQNTIMVREVIPYFMLLPNIGRMDDVWGSYLAQSLLFKNKPIVAYGPATVYQKRNAHNLFNDFKNESLGYRKTSMFLKNGLSVLPTKTKKCFEIYQSYF